MKHYPEGHGESRSVVPTAKLIEATMDILARLKSLFASDPVEPSSARKLNAGSEAALAASIKGLRPGERAWITFEEGRALFSVLHRALPDLQGMKPGSTCCSHLLQRTTSVGLFLPSDGRSICVRRIGRAGQTQPRGLCNGSSRRTRF